MSTAGLKVSFAPRNSRDHNVYRRRLPYRNFYILNNGMVSPNSNQKEHVVREPQLSPSKSISDTSTDIDGVLAVWEDIARHTASTEAKSLRRILNPSHRESYTYTTVCQHHASPQCRRKSRHSASQQRTKLPDRLSHHTGPCPRLRYIMDDELTNIDRFGVPPHLWGRQKPADKQLIDRLAKPTTSYSQRQALTLQQYKRKASK